MPNLLNMHLWGMHANIYATYDIDSTNDVARISLHSDDSDDTG